MTTYKFKRNKLTDKIYVVSRIKEMPVVANADLEIIAQLLTKTAKKLVKK